MKCEENGTFQRKFLTNKVEELSGVWIEDSMPIKIRIADSIVETLDFDFMTGQSFYRSNPGDVLLLYVCQPNLELKA